MQQIVWQRRFSQESAHAFVEGGSLSACGLVEFQEGCPTETEARLPCIRCRAAIIDNPTDVADVADVAKALHQPLARVNWAWQSHRIRSFERINDAGQIVWQVSLGEARRYFDRLSGAKSNG